MRFSVAALALAAPVVFAQTTTTVYLTSSIIETSIVMVSHPKLLINEPNQV